MRRKRVLLLSEGFGSGHTRAALAVSASLRMLTDGVRTRVLELGTFQHPTIAPWIFYAYRKTVISQPKLYGMLYRNQYKPFNRVVSMALHRIFYSRTENIIRKMQPDMIVCTHPFPNVVVSRLKRSGLDVPLCTVITDYDAHGTWIDPAVNRYFVSTEDVKIKLIRQGVPADSIEVTGIPVHPDFYGHSDKDEIRARYGLKEMPTVMIMGGGWGLISNEDLIQYASRWKEEIQLIFCLGSNEKLRLKMAEDPALQHPNIHLIGYTNEIDKLMDVSDLLLTKPGGMTCTEAMAKGIPMLFYSRIPGQEDENGQYFVDHGFAAQIESYATIDSWFSRLVREYPDFLQKRSWTQQDLRQNPRECWQAIIEYLESAGSTRQAELGLSVDDRTPQQFVK